MEPQAYRYQPLVIFFFIEVVFRIVFTLDMIGLVVIEVQGCLSNSLDR